MGYINLKNAVGSRKSTQAIGVPRQLLLHCPTYLHPCRHSKTEKLLITNKVTTNFSVSQAHQHLTSLFRAQLRFLGLKVILKLFGGMQ